MTVAAKLANRVHDEGRRKDIGAGLHTPMFLAKWPIIGLLMFILGGLAYNLVVHGPLIALEQMLANTFLAIGLQSPAFVKPFIDSGFYIGKEVIILVEALLIIYFLFKRYWFEMLSQTIARPRPATQIWIIVNLPSFSSGHAINVVDCHEFASVQVGSQNADSVLENGCDRSGSVDYRLCWLQPHLHRRPLYLTDILAGYAVGIARFRLAYMLNVDRDVLSRKKD